MSLTNIGNDTKNDKDSKNDNDSKNDYDSSVHFTEAQCLVIQRELCSVIVAGFQIFYRQKSDVINIMTKLLTERKSVGSLAIEDEVSL